ncbi:hypothetical protein FB45DRAFT_425745 [Roridomyces roridus]|uniref:F-box domain-containing protein n=1 Tax=Roridomyces roridus TaxID=1738132 RepID=A0AAD7C5P6_9AGAR|nr:hypothetical protein FB45DRAFT_425745 [Roridomyces roridus]
MSMATIHTLSPEVLALIFEWCSESGPGPRRPYTATAPLLLTRISHHWRNVALSTPSLWCSLQLGIDRLGVRLPFLRRWLGRSGSLPLALDLAYNYTWAVPTAIDGVLRPHANQIEWLRLYFPCSDLVRIGRLAFPKLRYLDYNWNDVDDTKLANVDLFACAPQLSELCTRGHSLPSLLVQSQFPWAQLTTFECFGYSQHDCLQVLRLAPSLQCCTLIDETQQ